MLVVISIIAILAAMLLPVLTRAKRQAQINQAKIEIKQIETAIQGYDSAYNRFPMSSNAVNAAVAGKEDFTYGTPTLRAKAGWTPGPPLPPPVANYYNNPPANNYLENNEVIAILMDWTNFPNGNPVMFNINHTRNPQRTQFLNAKMVSQTNLPGIGPDGVYRDPWGNPYIISLDVNYDNRTRDVFYRMAQISAVGSGPGGYNGLTDSQGGNYYEANGSVMVWSIGPDKALSLTSKANADPNRDNVVSWK
jgi:type II secretory pathway pseudopilin PulG